jgi:Protein of unknown function (DUF1176).
MLLRLTTFAALLTFLGGQALLPTRAEADALGHFHYKQWHAQCGPDYCKLTPRAHPILSLVRAHTGGSWLLSFRNREMVEEGTILIDGVEMGWQDEVEMAFPGPLLDGNILEIVYEAEGFSEGVSLAGVRAAMLWVEEQQGQFGVQNLRIHHPDWQALQDEARAMTTEMCDGSAPWVEENESAPQEIEGHPELRVLAQLCWTAAYNVGSQVYLLGPVMDGVDPVRVAAVDPDGMPVPELALWGVDGNTQLLDSYYKGRGLGDCFTHETYRFDGFNYDLERRVVDDACDGKIIAQVVWPE